ncbi:hypothetical protein EW146_g7221 [Bondarzewia mesenterica]|uniref:Uncharacterized protein n=1 Tax=Bondarzewia mesenterica TaxID=1095465 RepID=A0A4S4LN81_9AGAM|nr:hypothetical protein EW146_g7221 [Bondarzewia mesenterica]
MVFLHVTIVRTAHSRSCQQPDSNPLARAISLNQRCHARIVVRNLAATQSSSNPTPSSFGTGFAWCLRMFSVRNLRVRIPLEIAYPGFSAAHIFIVYGHIAPAIPYRGLDPNALNVPQLQTVSNLATWSSTLGAQYSGFSSRWTPEVLILVSYEQGPTLVVIFVRASSANHGSGSFTPTPFLKP